VRAFFFLLFLFFSFSCELALHCVGRGWSFRFVSFFSGVSVFVLGVFFFFFFFFFFPLLFLGVVMGLGYFLDMYCVKIAARNGRRGGGMDAWIDAL